MLTSTSTTNSTCLLTHSCDCRKYSNCLTCKEEPGCGWCSERQTCEVTSTSTCSFFAHSCPVCSTYQNCESCVPQADCEWCVVLFEQGCTPSSNCSVGARTKTCSSVCQLNGDCDSCTRQAGCGWCESKKSCVGFDTTDSACSMLTHSCPNQIKSFSGASFVGGMFLVIGIGLLIGAGFFAFRFFQKRQVILFFNFSSFI